jgi:PAS domain S-box-containing protein
MIIRDISERKRIETALRESKHRYHSLFESIHDAILVTDAERTIVECNRGFSDLFGYRLEEIRGQKTSLIYETVEDYRRVGASLQNHENFPVALHTLRYRKKTGELFPGEISIYHLCDAEGNIQGLIGLIRDVSRRVQAEEGQEQAEAQLRQAQKLESIGRLAGGVAHDFNNMLGVIIGYTQMAMDRLEPENQLTEDLQEVLKAAHRSKEIARQLLTFARKQSINPELLDLNRAVGNMVKMLRHMIGEDIELLWHPGPLALPVRIDPTQVDQILANLCVNARDAIDGTGKVTIRTAHVTFNETYCAFYPDFMPGDYVLLGVSDDGCGMEKDLLENIFEPFFTTKESGRGTGLGLPMIYGIVKQNNGFVNVYSEPENGTTINVYLPSQAAK